jgi:hypothetical protein
VYEALSYYCVRREKREERREKREERRERRERRTGDAPVTKPLVYVALSH